MQSTGKDKNKGPFGEFQNDFRPISMFQVGDVVITRRGYRVLVLSEEDNKTVRVKDLESEREVRCPPWMLVKKLLSAEDLRG